MDNCFLGINLKKLRKDNNLSQNQLGKILEVSGAYIQQIEKGIKNNPSIDLIYKIAEFFDIAPIELLERNLTDLSQEFNKLNKLSENLREQALNKDKNYKTNKYFNQLFIKPSKWEENIKLKCVKVSPGMIIGKENFDLKELSKKYTFTEDEIITTLIEDYESDVLNLNLDYDQITDKKKIEEIKPIIRGIIKLYLEQFQK